MFCIFYALFGVPLILITVTDIGKVCIELKAFLVTFFSSCPNTLSGCTRAIHMPSIGSEIVFLVISQEWQTVPGMKHNGTCFVHNCMNWDLTMLPDR